MNSTAPVNNTRVIAICIILFTGFLFLFNTGKRDLWAPDEPRYAQVSKEMRDTGNFVVPHLNSAPYPDKPPLLFWLINLFSLSSGKITALSSRLPSAFAGIGCCLALFYFGKRLYRNTRIGLLSALILATSAKFLWMAHRAAFDVLLTFFVTMAIICFQKGYAGQKNKGRYYTLFYTFMALGVLTKGPVGFILPFCVVLTYLVLKKDARAFKDTRPWIGGALFVFMVFTWVFLAGVYGGKEYTYQILFNQNVGRFSNSFAHQRPFYYYFIHFPVNFSPWSIFIPSIVIFLVSRKGRERIGEILLPLVWFVVVFIFLSIVSGKRDIYVLPLYPAASLLAAWFLNEFIEQFRERSFKKTGYYPCSVLCGVALVSGVFLPVVVYKMYPQYALLSIPFAIILVAGGILLSRFIKHARIIPFLFTLIFMILIIFNLSTLKVIPVLNQYKSAKEICDKANSMIKPGEQLALYNFFRDPYLFYTGRNYLEIIRGGDDLMQFLKAQERVFLFIQEKDFREVSKFPEIPVFVLAKDSVGHRDVLLISNKDR
ncbi:MAG: glycosyltransferase family 39 protein [Candidatus Brocadia sp.]|nr:glycosyltransferase family 39 protein [Candidatus Brocadia sp.]MDG6025199.1 glycosyltransferase family 39 protein [Candidatus Brocadia sp.]